MGVTTRTTWSDERSGAARGRSRRAGLGIAVTLCLAVLAAGCSSAMSIEDYATSIDASADAYVDESQDLSFDYQSAVEDGAREIVESGVDDAEAAIVVLLVAETNQYLALLEDAMARYAAELDTLSPPDAVSDLHDDYVESVVFVQTTLPETRNEVTAAETIADVQQAISLSGFADGQLRWTASCEALEAGVRAEGRGVDLGCVRSETSP